MGGGSASETEKARCSREVWRSRFEALLLREHMLARCHRAEQCRISSCLLRDCEICQSHNQSSSPSDQTSTSAALRGNMSTLGQEHVPGSCAPLVFDSLGVAQPAAQRSAKPRKPPPCVQKSSEKSQGGKEAGQIAAGSAASRGGCLALCVNGSRPALGIHPNIKCTRCLPPTQRMLSSSLTKFESPLCATKACAHCHQPPGTEAAPDDAHRSDVGHTLNHAFLEARRDSQQRADVSTSVYGVKAADVHRLTLLLSKQKGSRLWPVSDRTGMRDPIIHVCQQRGTQRLVRQAALLLGPPRASYSLFCCSQLFVRPSSVGHRTV